VRVAIAQIEFSPPERAGCRLSTFNGVDRSKEFNPAPNAFFFDWHSRNFENLYSAYSLLNDRQVDQIRLIADYSDKEVDRETALSAN
jgi:hypothetical protein